MSRKTKSAGRCTECGRALAVWRLADGRVLPIGSGDGCPCGGSAFELLTSPASAE